MITEAKRITNHGTAIKMLDEHMKNAGLHGFYMSQTKVLHISGKENKDAKTQCRKGDSRDRCTPEKE